MDRPDLPRKRPRSRSPPPWYSQAKSPRYNDGPGQRKSYQGRHGQTSMDREERDWVAKEDDFVLKQAKKKAQIRVREGRAKPIDWLAVILAVVDLEKEILEDDGSQDDIELADPVALVEDLALQDLQELLKDVDHYSALEKHAESLRFWRSLKSLINERIRHLAPSGGRARGIGSVSEDVARLLGPKTKQQLDVLEEQVRTKLKSDDSIDVEYWEHLLDSIGIYKARSQLSTFYESVLGRRTRKLKQEQGAAARAAQQSLAQSLRSAAFTVSSTHHLVSRDPEPLLKIPAADKSTKILSEEAFVASIATERQRIERMGYVPKAMRKPDNVAHSHASRVVQGDASQITNAMYDREAARGVEDDEEVFAAEAEVQVLKTKNWEGAYKPRKPKYFNRVQTGYEWNKYNQTHYDQDNPPPKVVQGYKFNIFYPDLIDKTKAPTYKIERENGRKRGESFAAAGEEDTCIIRFFSGPPYEDLAFRIVDKEWDYSARRERGFKSSFDKGTLQLHFQFKKVYYRK